MCELVPQVPNRTEIVIVRHVLESRLTSNTARLAHLALAKCQLIDYGGPTPFDDTRLGDADSWLLYPGPIRAMPAQAPQRLIVLDGTFHQTRRMYKRIAALRTMPELALAAPDAAILRLRQPTRGDGMSTIEAIAIALERVEGTAISRPLLDLFTTFVRRVDWVRGRSREHVAAGAGEER